MRAARLCSCIGCEELVYGSARYCDVHVQERRKREDSSRPSSARRGYDAAWQKVRAAHLRTYPWCSECGKRANEVDHKTPLRDGGSNDESNLRSLCKKCHSRHTATNGGGFGNQARVGA